MKEADTNPYALTVHTQVSDRDFPSSCVILRAYFQALFQPSEMALLCAPRVLPLLLVPILSFTIGITDTQTFTVLRTSKKMAASCSPLVLSLSPALPAFNILV